MGLALGTQLLCAHLSLRHATLTALLNNRFRRLCDFYQLTGGTMSSTCTQLRQRYSNCGATIKGVRAKMCDVDTDASDANDATDASSTENDDDDDDDDDAAAES